MNGVPRDRAREQVRDDIDQVLNEWAAASRPTSLSSEAIRETAPPDT